MRLDKRFVIWRNGALEFQTALPRDASGITSGTAHYREVITSCGPSYTVNSCRLCSLLRWNIKAKGNELSGIKLK